MKLTRRLCLENGETITGIGKLGAQERLEEEKSV